MKKYAIMALVCMFLIGLAVPVLAKVTIKNNTDIRFEVEIKDSRARKSYFLNTSEKQSFTTSQGGGKVTIYKKGEEITKSAFDDGDCFIIVIEGENVVIKKVRNL
ncbi:MAG: hypothetical protein RDV48_06440 [Candidatus Eremiobacteraeota bacterium]|nr:hypothetical protein [Candidatus Eremiobacteraeota bacterium]